MDVSFDYVRRVIPATITHFIVGAAPAAAPPVLFRANFNASDQSFSDTQVLSTQATGIQDSKMYINLSGSGSGDTIGILSNALSIYEPSGLLSWYYTYPVPADRGIATHIVFQVTGTFQNWWGANGYFGAGTGPTGAWMFNGWIGWNLAGVAVQMPEAYTVNTDIELVQLFGGFDVNGIPWDGSSSFDYYNYGSVLFRNSGGEWRLIMADRTQLRTVVGGSNTNLVNCGQAAYTMSAGNKITTKQLVVHGTDFKSALTPVFRAVSPALDSTYTGLADQWFSFGITTLPSAGSITVQFRITDATNFWSVNVSSAGTLTLVETVSGTPTTRGTLAAILASGNFVGVWMIGTSLAVYPLGGSAANSIWYSPAGSGTTATGLKISDLGTGGVIGWIAGLQSHNFSSSQMPPFMASVSFTDPPPINQVSGSPTNQLTLDGDSMIDPDSLSRGGVEKFLNSLMGGNWTVTNFAVGASTWANLVSRQATTDATFNGANTANKLVLWCGTNDGYLSGSTGATAAAAAQSYITTSLATWGSGNIIFISMLDRTQTGGAWPPGGSIADMNTFRSAYNSAMQTWCAANGVYYLDPTVNGQLTDSTDLNYFRDDPTGVHPGYFGCSIVAQIVHDYIIP